MSRVLPMIVTCLGFVGYAVFQAHAGSTEEYAHVVPMSEPVVIETLD